MLIDVNELYGCFLKWGYPQSSPISRWDFPPFPPSSYKRGTPVSGNWPFGSWNSHWLILTWLVVGPPLWKIWKSIGMISNPIYGNIINVPNRQPDDVASLAWGFSCEPTVDDCTFEGPLPAIWWLYMEVSVNGGPPKWMVYKGKSNWNGWFGGTPISGNLHMINHDNHSIVSRFQSTNVLDNFEHIYPPETSWYTI